MMMKRIIPPFLAIVLFSCLCLAADKQEQPLDLVHADRLLSTGKDINNITNLIGNVHLRHGSAELWAERAVWYKKTDIIVFIDSVKLIDGPRILTSETLTYYRNTGSATATGDVVLLDELEELRLTAARVDYEGDEDRFIATGEPVLRINPHDDSSMTEIVGDSIVYNPRSKTGVATKNVIVQRRNIKATCNRAEFYELGERIILSENPEVIQGKNLLEGDDIELFTTDKVLTGMIINGHAKATYLSQQDSTVEEFTEAILEGKQLEVFFENDSPSSAVMRRNATSFYIPAVNDTFASGKNVASGDSITLFFDDSRVNRVLILGGAQGHYVENKLQENDEIQPETTFYSAQSIDYKVDDSMIELLKKAKIKYQQMVLESGQINYDIEEGILIAEGLVEKTDSGEVSIDTPVLREAGDELYGQRMAYNINTRKGKVDIGETEFEGGYYRGKLLRQVDKDVLFVSSGQYTTCDLDHPHFRFYSHRMKMIAKDKIIARPVILFVGPLPVAAIPYYVFPIRKGRHSGFLTFELGNFREGERFIRNVGYYWAASDYWDTEASLDYYENDRIIINSELDYRLRYKFNGRVRGSFSRQTRWQDYERQVTLGWGLNFTHSQTLTESMSLRASGSFQSSKDYNIDNSYDPDERLRRTLRSNVSFNKRWKSESMTIALDQSWNLDTDVKTQLLPTVSFSRSSLPIIPPPSKQKKSKRVLTWEEQDVENLGRWYHSFYFSVNSRFQNRRHQSKKSDILDWENFKTVDSRINLSSPQKLFGVITVNPSASIRQTFYKIDKIHAADTVDVVTDDYFRREVWSAALSAKTDLYGTVYPNLLHITGFRHVMTPSISYNYAPKSDRNKEYYEFTRVGSSSSKRKNMAFSLTNLFQMKYQSGEKEKKFDLFNLRFSTTYDFEKEEQKWGNLSSVLFSSALKVITFSLSSIHSFYDEQTGEERLWDPRLVNISASLNFTRSFQFGAEEDEDLPEEEADKKGVVDLRREKRGKARGDRESSLVLNISHRFSERHSLGHISKTRWVDVSVDLGLTAGWRVKYDCHYDLQSKQSSSMNLKLGRDLHCWQGEFVWVPVGPLAGYYFRISIKKLPDIKVEQSVGGVRGKFY